MQTLESRLTNAKTPVKSHRKWLYRQRIQVIARWTSVSSTSTPRCLGFERRCPSLQVSTECMISFALSTFINLFKSHIFSPIFSHFATPSHSICIIGAALRCVVPGFKRRAGRFSRQKSVLNRVQKAQKGKLRSAIQRMNSGPALG